ncbi:MAG: DNA mismatch repair protein MutL [Deltaproteobacteria bacterium CG11_big_fil_rev_8_21_14_0_20_47_16]|nr:MAG: DNA mismatch repair protein MutL [Deltaproteobacteria bacterium CG11_big_fil_rev_8_21_14_0_20_47_16]
MTDSRFGLDGWEGARYGRTMSRIQILSKEVANLIAAGEVVERPVSVVKELVENALDAGATSVTVDLQDGGTTRIQVSDNGCGMTADELALCVLPHATSKIGSADDLARIMTFGFRGEALPSIAAVSHVLITSKTPTSDSAACIRVDAGKMGAVEPCSAPDGTLILVEHLFQNVPARQKFLKSERTEYGHIFDLIQRVALANPQTRFVLRHQGKETLRANVTTELRGRVAELFSVNAAEQLLPFSEDSGGVRISGFAGRPILAKAGSPQTYLTVNGRVVKDRLLMHAVGEAYRTFLPRELYPFCVVQLELDPSLVDVNVHPAKAEVRFVQPQAMHQLVVHTLRAALQQASSDAMTLGNSTASASPVASYGNDSLTGPASPAGSWPDLRPPASSGETPLFNTEDMPALRPIGALARTYLLYEDPNGSLIAIDQHAAHERLGYLKLKERFAAADLQVQRLLIPAVVELSPRDHAMALESIELLGRCGMEVNDFGGNSVVIKSVPALLANTDPVTLLKRLLEDLAQSGTTTSMDVAIDHVLMTMACHRMVRAGDYLSGEEIVALADEVMATPTADRCPHGRPTWVRIPKSEIEKWFYRK